MPKNTIIENEAGKTFDDKQKRYSEYLKKQYDLSFEYAMLISNDNIEDITLSVFDKITTPWIYFEQDKKNDKATDKQLSFAKKLGIGNPELFSKTELSKMIDSAKQNRII